MKNNYGVTCPPPGRSTTSGDVTVHWAGAEQWFVIADKFAEGALYRDLVERLAGLASVSDQSHGRVILLLSGAHARDVIAKGTPVDVHPREFAPGHCAVTQMAHVGVHLACVGTDAYELSLFRGFAESFWHWLGEMAEEFGTQVK
ncbi:MAG: sarcosine oxidase subunit gamma family protein [Alphaproteobacteria bacterium]